MDPPSKCCSLADSEVCLIRFCQPQKDSTSKISRNGKKKKKTLPEKVVCSQRRVSVRKRADLRKIGCQRAGRRRLSPSISRMFILLIGIGVRKWGEIVFAGFDNSPRRGWMAGACGLQTFDCHDHARVCTCTDVRAQQGA